MSKENKKQKSQKKLDYFVNKCEEYGVTVIFSQFFFILVDPKLQRANAHIDPSAGFVSALNSYFPEKEVIVIDASLSNETKLYLLIHEFGHALQKVFFDKILSKKLIKKTFQISSSNQTDTNSKKILIEHEMDAWNLGAEFAKEVGIKLPKAFFDLKQEKIQTYMDLKEV